MIKLDLDRILCKKRLKRGQSNACKASDTFKVQEETMSKTDMQYSAVQVRANQPGRGK